MKVISSKRFAVQLILMFVSFTLGSAILLGIPAAWLFVRQSEVQLDALVEQSLQTTFALFDNRITQIQSLSALLAERPTMNQLVLEEDFSALSQYLENILKNADLDMILVCRDNQKMVAVGEGMDIDSCNAVRSMEMMDMGESSWLLTSTFLGSDITGDIWITVGQKVSSILDGFNEQTGMEYSLYTETGRLIFTTFDAELAQSSLPETTDEHYQRIMVGSSAMIQAPVVMPVLGEYRLYGSLNIDPYQERTRQFRNLFLFTLGGVSLVGGGVAVLVARRISTPLNQLAKSAASLREGDLQTPLRTPSDVWEIDQLSNALEDARVSLKYSLDQLRQEKLRIENLMNSMVEGLVTVDDNFRITYASRSVERISNLDSTLILGKHLDDVFLPTPGESTFSQQIPETNQSRRIPVIIDEKEVLLSVSASTVLPAESGNATRALMLRDVSNEERVHRLVGEFLANITHEFRTPLSALAASVELLRDELPNLSVEEAGQLLEALNIGIIDLQSLIDNLIEAASIEAGRFKVNPKSIELSEILSDAVKTIQPLIIKKKLRLQMVDPIPSFLVRADQRRSVQALVNLLSNAIKHSPELGQLSLRSLLLEQEVLLEIQDEGPGVQPEFQGRLFKRFASHESGQDLSSMGMGLGLSVVKAVIEAQGGRVGYRNREEGGAIFWFTLPLVSEDSA